MLFIPRKREEKIAPLISDFRGLLAIAGQLNCSYSAKAKANQINELDCMICVLAPLVPSPAASLSAPSSAEVGSSPLRSTTRFALCSQLTKLIVQPIARKERRMGLLSGSSIRGCSAEVIFHNRHSASGRRHAALSDCACRRESNIFRRKQKYSTLESFRCARAMRKSRCVDNCSSARNVCKQFHLR